MFRRKRESRQRRGADSGQQPRGMDLPVSDKLEVQLDLLTVCMLVANHRPGWPPVGDLAAIATQARDEGSMTRLLAGRVTAAGDTADGDDAAPAERTPPTGPLGKLEFTREAITRTGPELRDHVRGLAYDQIAAAAADDAHLSTVLDDDFPSQLRATGDVPYLFWRGELDPERDTMSVAIDGSVPAETCRADDAEFVSRVAHELAAADTPVVARLERGIGQQALEAALEAGGRCIAVRYSGLSSSDWQLPVLEDLNGLAARICGAGGLVVSQLLPTHEWAMPGWSRYLIASEMLTGIGQGLVIVRGQPDDSAQSAQDFESFEEAHSLSLTSTSITDIATQNRGGYSPEFLSARRTQEQARIAVRQGRRAMLRDQMQTHLQWPNEMIRSGEATAFNVAVEVISAMAVR